MLHLLLFVLCVQTFAVLVASLNICWNQYHGENRMAAVLQDVLDATVALSASFDAFVGRIPAGTPPVDLQPAVDAIKALGARIDATAA